jgi:hypothetical protein
MTSRIISLATQFLPFLRREISSVWYSVVFNLQRQKRNVEILLGTTKGDWRDVRSGRRCQKGLRMQRKETKEWAK